MKKELIVELFQRFENACYIYEGVECWSAPRLENWRQFNYCISLSLLVKIFL